MYCKIPFVEQSQNDKIRDGEQISDCQQGGMVGEGDGCDYTEYNEGGIV